MHIITGLLLAKLLKAGKGKTQAPNTSPLLNMPGVITLAHSLPGRCRFRIPLLVGQSEASNKLIERLQGVDGVADVKIDCVTGSVLLSYDAATLNAEVLAAALVRLLGLERAFSGKVEASLGRELREWAKSLNVAVYQKTGGVLDLRTALMLGLIGIGIKKAITQRSLALPASFTLLWWAGTGLLREDGASE